MAYGYYACILQLGGDSGMANLNHSVKDYTPCTSICIAMLLGSYTNTHSCSVRTSLLATIIVVTICYIRVPGTGTHSFVVYSWLLLLILSCQKP